ncbi:MAG: hypothetical protein ACLS5G_07380 [Streptococcus sp.]
MKGEFVSYRGDHYYDKETGALVTGKYFEHKNNWYYANSKGNILTGRRVIDGKHVYFYDDDYGQYKGIQAKDKLIILDGKTYYYLPGSGNRADNVTLTINRYYFDNDELTYPSIVTYKYYGLQLFHTKEVDQLSASFSYNQSLSFKQNPIMTFLNITIIL